MLQSAELIPSTQSLAQRGTALAATWLILNIQQPSVALDIPINTALGYRLLQNTVNK